MRNPIKKGQYLTKFMPLSVVNRDSKHAQTKAWKKALGESDSLPEGQIRAWGSTVEPDRDEHMILPEAAKEYLPHFLACPTFLLNHDWTGDIEQHLGSVLDITIVPNVGLDCLFEYDFDLTKTCRAVYEKTKKGSIRGYSLGFYVHDFVTLASPQEQIDALPAYARQALQDGRVWIVFTKIEIVEISAVFIPSNRGALRSSSASATQTKNERGSTMELDQVLAKM
ncbi:MAG: HK97 family phage prohead protease, partial [Vulcanimicrobiota bacterium]